MPRAFQRVVGCGSLLTQPHPPTAQTLLPHRPAARVKWGKVTFTRVPLRKSPQTPSTRTSCPQTTFPSSHCSPPAPAPGKPPSHPTPNSKAGPLPSAPCQPPTATRLHPMDIWWGASTSHARASPPLLPEVGVSCAPARATSSDVGCPPFPLRDGSRPRGPHSCPAAGALLSHRLWSGNHVAFSLSLTTVTLERWTFPAVTRPHYTLP